MNRDEILDLLAHLQIFPESGKMIADENYVFPQETWLRDTFGPALKTFLSGAGLTQWVAQSGDCDDFAAIARVYASILHRKTPGSRDAALCFGEFWYLQDRGGGHAINFAIVADQRGDAKIVFYEPQLYAIVHLTKQEIQSCRGLRL